MKKTYLLIIFLATNIFFCSGEDSGKTVFATSLLSDNDLYLSLEGSWTFDLTTFANGTPSDIFKNLSFKQKPDLSASIWLFNKFFFETNIISNSDENIFLLGYQNSGEGGLKEFRIGNDDLNISEYAHYTPPINKNRSPGIRAKIENSNSTHEILGIYSKEDRNLVTYRGFQNVDTDTLDITNYTTGYFFVLPIEVNDFNLIYSNDSSELLTVEKNNFNYYKNKHLLYVENTDFNKIYIDVNEFEQSELTTILYNFIDPDNNPGIVTTLTATEIWDKYIKIIDGKNYLSIFSVGEFSPLST
ncbi:hypothetical protein EW093_03600 [Thiospirochaeta perfilievii]|uniref:Uncharacterized protein n=1 Tax=Thiospirochaeta perfilievii TaxID=252967 RepID=A0A5C1Q8K4_9SPIO|nr:hypothetical protein [Thiospirochaeta perfilievii]QEN03821.1 hypothetical protein EW093_03600 [Thiospirochaeta perfilievii]